MPPSPEPSQASNRSRFTTAAPEGSWGTTVRSKACDCGEKTLHQLVPRADPTGDVDVDQVDLVQTQVIPFGVHGQGVRPRADQHDPNRKRDPGQLHALEQLLHQEIIARPDQHDVAQDQAPRRRAKEMGVTPLKFSMPWRNSVRRSLP